MKQLGGSMNKLLADLNVLYVKTHNYHYNVVGLDFKSVHVQLEEEYDQIHMWIDQVAEDMKKEGEYPPASLKEYLAITSIEEVESKDYRSIDIYKSMVLDYETLEKDIHEIKAKDISASREDLLNGMLEMLNTKLWFFKASAK